jgi:hypothetical protein
LIPTRRILQINFIRRMPGGGAVAATDCTCCLFENLKYQDLG